MNLIDSSYFIGEINIPGTDRPEIAKSLSWFIFKYESQLLQQVLGYDLWKSFTTAITVDPIDELWTDLLQGKEYTDTFGTVRRWRGLIESDMAVVTVIENLNKSTSTVKKSFLANYIYYWYMQNNSSQTTTVTEVRGKVQNSVQITPIRKMVWAWNEMSSVIEELWCYLQSRKDDYTDWNYSEPCRWKFAKINEFNV